MLAKAYAATDMVLGQKLPKPMNAAPQHHYVMQAALRALDRWVRTGEAPPIAERLQVSDSGALVLDAHGNARGGVRSSEEGSGGKEVVRNCRSWWSPVHSKQKNRRTK